MNLPSRIESQIATCGPQSVRDLARDLEADFDAVSARIGSMKRQKRIRIADWRRDEDGGYLYPRALWGIGSAPDTPRIAPLTHTQYNQRQRKRRRLAVPSVFHLGIPVDKRRLRA